MSTEVELEREPGLPETFEEFIEDCQWTHENVPSYRWGQAVFNTLASVRPDLSEQIRTTELDPFYTRDGDSITATLKWIKENWG